MFSIVLLLVAAASGPLSSPLGALEIHTAPGAEVLWEGISLGATDSEGLLLIERVPPGRYTVGLRKEGFRNADVQVAIEAGATTRFDLPLKKLPPPRRALDPVPKNGPPRPSAIPPSTQAAQPRPSPPSQEAPSAEVAEETVAATATALAGEGDETPTGAERRPPLATSLLALIALAGGVGLYITRRRQLQAPLHLRRRQLSIPPDEKIVSQTEDDTGFIETLKQQEQRLDDVEPGSWKREPEIIEAEYIEVWETHEE